MSGRDDDAGELPDRATYIAFGVSHVGKDEEYWGAEYDRVMNATDSTAATGHLD